MNHLFKAIDRNELTYWLGLAMIFAGLAMGISVATALCVAGGLIALESVATSYLATWMATRTGK